MSPVDASNNPKATTKYKVVDYVKNIDQRNIISKRFTTNWNRELHKVSQALKTHQPTIEMKTLKVKL